MFSPTYYSYYDSYSLRLNIFGSIWLKQNFECLNDVYKDLKNKCTEIIKYFSQYEKVYNTFKIEKTIDCCNAYFDLMVRGGRNNPVTIISLDRKNFSFSIGKDYCGNIKDFDKKKADDALCDFLKCYIKDCENYGIRFFKDDKGGNVIE